MFLSSASKMTVQCLVFLDYGCHAWTLAKRPLVKRDHAPSQRAWIHPGRDSAERVGLIQSLVCDYEKDRLRLSAEMALRFALALDISVDELIRPKNTKPVANKPARKVLRRLELIESLPSHQQQTVLKTIDTMLKGLRSAS